MSDDDEFMTIAEVASGLRVTPMVLYRLVGSGKVKAVRVGRSWRVPVTEFRRLREEGTG